MGIQFVAEDGFSALCASAFLPNTPWSFFASGIDLGNCSFCLVPSGIGCGECGYQWSAADNAWGQTSNECVAPCECEPPATDGTTDGETTTTRCLSHVSSSSSSSSHSSSSSSGCGTCLWGAGYEYTGGPLVWVLIENYCTGPCSCPAPDLIPTENGETFPANCSGT